jgi:chemotaxis protein CheZ
MTEATPISADERFDRLGQITRQLHQAMTELGFDVQLQRLAHEIPDARDRLSHVGQMTDSAAHTVLGLVEEAKPGCAHLAEHAQGVQRDLERLLADGGTTTPALRDGLHRMQAFAGAAAGHARQQERVLSEIMMSQEFQDLSGQVIKKVIDIISRTEGQLVQLLKESAPEHVIAAVAAANAGFLQGPQTADKALKQDDVDDLLASLGF